MLRTTVVAAVLASAVLLTVSAVAQSDASKVYQAKCAACHAADGKGSSMGQKLGTHDFHGSDVQGQSDAELTDAIAKGKGKMPSYEKSLKPDDIKGLVAYIRELGRK